MITESEKEKKVFKTNSTRRHNFKIWSWVRVRVQNFGDSMRKKSTFFFFFCLSVFIKSWTLFSPMFSFSHFFPLKCANLLKLVEWKGWESKTDRKTERQKESLMSCEVLPLDTKYQSRNTSTYNVTTCNWNCKTFWIWNFGLNVFWNLLHQNKKCLLFKFKFGCKDCIASERKIQILTIIYK